MKSGGGNAGHNGLRSISAHVGNEYRRVRIGVGHPGSKDLVSHYVLHDFAKADQEWLEPMLDAMADAAGRLAAGDAARFLTDVARRLQPERSGKGERGDGKGEKGGKGSGSVELADAEADVPAPRAAAATPAPTPGHPAGERQSKRGSALAENLKRWLRGNRGPAS